MNWTVGHIIHGLNQIHQTVGACWTGQQLLIRHSFKKISSDMAWSELTPDKFHLNIYCTQRCQLNLKLLLGNNILDFVPIHIQTGMQLFINIFFHWIDNWNSHKVLTNEEYYELKPTSGLEGFTVMLNVTIAMILSIMFSPTTIEPIRPVPKWLFLWKWGK